MQVTNTLLLRYISYNNFHIDRRGLVKEKELDTETVDGCTFVPLYSTVQYLTVHLCYTDTVPESWAWATVRAAIMPWLGQTSTWHNTIQ